MNQDKYICNICNKEFDNVYKLGGHKGSHKRYDGMITARRTIKSNCIECEDLITTGDIRRDRSRKFCSNECRWKNHRKKWDTSLIYNVPKKALIEYQSQVQLCEICKSPEVARTSINKSKDNKLCRDHNHATGNFRGLLCYSCNVKLGWYEKFGEEINHYLQENNDFAKVINKMGA